MRIGDAERARAALESVPESPEVLEGLAAASYVLFDYPRAIDEFERAYAGYRRVEDGTGAARAARTLGYLYGTTAGDWAVASGWISRAKTLLRDAPGSGERGWVALTEGMFAADRQAKDTAFRSAIQVGRETGDADLTFATSSYLGASLVHGDRVEEGMALLDEALAAVAGGDVEDFIVLEEIFCQLFSACEHTQDVRRAEQWIRVGEQIARRRNLPAVGAYCRTHYGGILPRPDVGRKPMLPSPKQCGCGRSAGGPSRPVPWSGSPTCGYDRAATTTPPASWRASTIRTPGRSERHCTWLRVKPLWRST